MKKFMKGCAWTALILIVAGFALALAASTVKGAEYIENALASVTNGRIRVNISDWKEWGVFLDKLEEKTDYDLDVSMIFEEDYEIFSGDIDMDFTDDGILGLDITVGGCEFRLEESEDGKFHVQAENTRKFQGFVEEDTLYIKGTTKSGLGSKIILFVPSDFSFEKVSMELGAGTMTIDHLTSAELNLDVGAGQITAKELAVDSLNTAVGMGEMVIEKMHAGRFTAQVGMGNLRAEGTVSEEAAVECAMGNIDLELTGTQKDYDYSIECGMGNVKIGSSSYSGMGNKKEVDNGAARRMNVECAVGNIDIRFED